MYSDTNAQEGYYEQHIGFFWSDGTSDKPQNFTIGFKLSEEMEDDFPHNVEEKEDISFEQGTKRREMWVADHIETLLDFDFAVDVYDHETISSIEKLEENLDRMGINAFYR